MKTKLSVAVALAASIGASQFAGADTAVLNPFVESDEGPTLVGADCFDFYPIFLNGFQGFDSLIALACLRFGTDPTPCVFDFYILPSGTSSWNISAGNIFAARELRFLDGSDFGLPLNRFAQIWIFDGSGGQNVFAGSRHFIFNSQGGFTADSPVTNCGG